MFFMKKSKTHVLLTWIIALLILVLCYASDAKFDVHVIYFKPTDAPDIDREYHDKILKDIQKYVQSEMTRHGFEDKTFPLELDENGKLIIHVINGKHDSDHYDIADNYTAQLALDVLNEKIEPELPIRFSNKRNIESRDNVHLIIVGGIQMNGNWRAGPAMGMTWHGGRWGGNALETMDRMHDFPNHYLAVIAHELGHAFGLDPGHNGVQQAFNGLEIAFGRTTAQWGNRMRILNFEAALLDNRPIFRKINLQQDNSEIHEDTSVLIYIGGVSWVSHDDADHQSQIAKELLLSEDIQAEITQNADDVRDWMIQTTSDGKADVLILYGVLPSSIYPSPNKKLDGSVAEIWIESTDGNTIINHGDYFGFVGGNGVKALQAIMDIPNITMWDFGLENNTPMIVTKDGKEITPSLANFRSDRAFHIDELIGDWFVEIALATNTGIFKATRSDPIIVRDGNRGRIGIAYQTFEEINPKGRVVSEMITNFLLPSNKNPDLDMDTDADSNQDTDDREKDDPISIRNVSSQNKLTTRWASLKQRN